MIPTSKLNPVNIIQHPNQKWPKKQVAFELVTTKICHSVRSPLKLLDVRFFNGSKKCQKHSFNIL